jgi:hypothetical protein
MARRTGHLLALTSAPEKATYARHGPNCRQEGEKNGNAIRQAIRAIRELAPCDRRRDKFWRVLHSNGNADDDDEKAGDLEESAGRIDAAHQTRGKGSHDVTADGQDAGSGASGSHEGPQSTHTAYANRFGKVS